MTATNSGSSMAVAKKGGAVPLKGPAWTLSLSLPVSFLKNYHESRIGIDSHGVKIQHRAKVSPTRVVLQRAGREIMHHLRQGTGAAAAREIGVGRYASF